MGRGRAKAKQTKVARDLKYRTHETDFGALAKELHGDEVDGEDKDDRPRPRPVVRLRRAPPRLTSRSGSRPGRPAGLAGCSPPRACRW